MSTGHKIEPERTYDGFRCAVCKCPLLPDGKGFYHDTRFYTPEMRRIWRPKTR